MSPLPALLAASLAHPATAEAFRCQVATDCGRTACVPDTLDIAFAIDRSQFAPALDPDEPPRNKVTTVTAGNAIFAAEPFVIGPVRGFWEDAEALGTRMLTIEADGAATYTDTHTGRTMTGHCEER